MINAYEYLNKFALAADTTVCNPSNVTAKLCNPLAGKLGVTDVPTLVNVLLNDLGKVLALIAITMVVYAGFRMVTANGDKAVIDKAKAILKYSLFGFAASILSYAGVVAVENFIGVQEFNGDSYNQTKNPLKYDNLKVFTEQMIRNVLLIIGLVSMLMIILNGYRYITARGNESQVDDAKRALTWAIAGLALSLFAYTIISALANLIYTK